MLYLNTKHILIVDNNFMPQIRISLLTKILPLFGLLLVVPLLSSHATLDPRIANQVLRLTTDFGPAVGSMGSQQTIQTAWAKIPHILSHREKFRQFLNVCVYF